MYKFNGNSFIKNFIWILLFIRFIRSFAHALAALHLQTAFAGQQCCIVDEANDDDDDQHADDDDVAPLQLPFAPILARPCPALPCPAVCFGHKSKEQIAAAKAVKANKPKCRRNKLANVMDAATQGQARHGKLRWCRQGVDFSCIVGLCSSLCFFLPFAVAKMRMQMLMHCPIGQVSFVRMRVHYTTTIHLIRVWVAASHRSSSLVNLSCSYVELWLKGSSRTFYTTSFPHAARVFMPPIMTH